MKLFHHALAPQIKPAALVRSSKLKKWLLKLLNTRVEIAGRAGVSRADGLFFPEPAAGAAPSPRAWEIYIEAGVERLWHDSWINWTPLSGPPYLGANPLSDRNNALPSGAVTGDVLVVAFFFDLEWSQPAGEAKLLATTVQHREMPRVVWLTQIVPKTPQYSEGLNPPPEFERKNEPVYFYPIARKLAGGRYHYFHKIGDDVEIQQLSGLALDPQNVA